MKMKKIFMFMPFLLAGFLLTLASCGNLGGGGSSVSGGGKDEHNWTLVTGKPATCQEEGMKDYYTCSHCNEYKGTDGSIYTSLDEFILHRVDHNYNYVEGFTGCEGEGLKTHYTCEYCDTLFDEYYNETTEEELKVVGQHNLNFVYGYEAGCYEAGRVSHYECSKCMECFEDENATVKINREDTIIPSTHNLTHYDEVKATCDNSGNKEYWRCESCYTYFLSEEAVTSVEWSEIYLSQLQHSFTNYDVESEETCDTDRVEVAHCDHEGCDEIDTRTIENSKLGHNFVDGKCTNCQCDVFSEGLEYYFEIDENDEAGIVITGLGTCTDRDIIIPEKLRGLPVVAVNFYYSIDIDSIYIPNTVRSIRRINSDNLKKVIIDEESSSLTEIAYEAFSGCSSLEEINLPETCKKIGYDAFNRCSSLMNIDLSHVVEISNSAFYGCESLVDIDLSSIQEIGTYAFAYTDSLNRVEIKNAPSFTSMGYNAFYDSGIRYVSFPSSLASISDYAFYDCDNLETVVFAEGNIYIETFAFADCDLLKEIDLPNSLVSINSYAFRKCQNLEVVKIDSSYLDSIDSEAFEDCTSLKEIYMPNSYDVTINNNAFLNTNIETLYFPNGHMNQWLTYNFESEASNPLYGGDVTIKVFVNQINDYQEIEYIDLTSTYGTTVPAYAFYNTKYEIKGLESVNFIGSYAFAYVKSITHAELTKCSTIDTYAFYNCENLETVNFLTPENNITGGGAISGYAFKGCNKITHLEIPNTIVAFGMGLFNGLNNLESISIPFIGLKNTTSEEYRQYPLGALFGTEKVEGTYAVSQKYYKVNLNSLVDETFYIPNSLKHVSVTAQEELLTGSLMNIKLDSLTINENCLTLHEDYNLCSSNSTETLIKNFIYKGSLAKWFTAKIHGLEGTGDYFYTYENGVKTLLEHIIIPENIIAINQNLFYGVDSVRSLTIDHKVLCNATYAFYCPNLYEIYITADPNEFGLVLTPGAYGEYGNASSNAKVVHYSSEEPSIFYTDENGFKFACLEEQCILVDVPSPIDGKLELPTSVTYNENTYETYSIQGGAFARVSGVEHLIIPNNINELYYGVFNDLLSVEILTIPSMYGLSIYQLYGYDKYDGPSYDGVTIDLKELYLTNETQNIAEDAFYLMEGIEVIHINGTLEEIGDYAFSNCISLREVILSDNIVTVGYDMFNKCSSLEKVWLSASFEYLENAMLYESRKTLKELRVPYLGSRLDATDGCSLAYLLGTPTYYEKPGLETLIILGGNFTGSIDEAYSIKNLTIPAYSYENNYFNVSAYEAIGKVENFYFAGTLEDWCNIDNTYLLALQNSDNFYLLDENKEYYLIDELETLTIPSTVNYIAPFAFYDLTGVDHIRFAESSDIITICEGAFAGIEDAKTIVFPENVEFVMENSTGGALYNSLFEEVTLPNLKVNGENKTLSYFMKWNYTSVSIENTTLKKLTLINDTNFTISQLRTFVAIEELYMPATITSNNYYPPATDSYAYLPSTFKAIYIDADLKTFCESKVSSLTCGTYPIYIKDENGEYYNLRELQTIIIPEGTSKITNYTFNNFSNVVIYIPSSVTTIEQTMVKYDKSGVSSTTNNVVFITGANSLTNAPSGIHYGYSLDDVYKDENYIFLLKDGEAKLVAVLNKEIVNAEIPSTITHNNQTYVVVELCPYVFSNIETLESVNIPDTVKIIGTHCFAGTTSLRKFVIPENVEYIGYRLFGSGMNNLPVVIYNYSLNESDFDSDWDYGDGSVADSTANYYVAYQTPISNGYCFIYKYFEDGDYEYVISEHYHNAVIMEEDTKVILSRYVGTDTEVVIPDTVIYNGDTYLVNEIGGKAFDGSNITKVTLGANIKKIGDRAFRNCDNLEEIVFNDAVSIISIFAFYDCDLLVDVYIPSNVMIIDDYAFADCGSLSGFVYNDREYSLDMGQHVLDNSNIRYYYHPSTIENSDWASANNDPTYAINKNDHIMYALVEAESSDGSITTYDSQRQMIIYYGVNDETLYNSEEHDATFYLDSKNSIAILMYVGVSITEIDVPSTLEVAGKTYTVKLGVACFANSPLETFTLPETITEIPDYCFYGTNIREIELEYIITIGDHAFAHCEMLSGIVISSTLETMGWNVLIGTYNVSYLDIPFIGESRDQTQPTIAHFYGGFVSNGILQSNKYLGARLTTLIIRETKVFYTDSLKGVGAEEMYLYGDIEEFSYDAYGYHLNEGTFDRIYIMSENVVKSELSDAAERFNTNKDTVILFVGSYNSSDGYYSSSVIYDNYNEDTYPVIDRITYKLEGTTARVIQIEHLFIENVETVNIPSTIEYKGNTYTVVENSN